MAGQWLRTLTISSLALVSLPMVAAPPVDHPGALDGGFGGDGKVITHFRTDRWAQALAIAPDGRIVAAGWGANTRCPRGFCHFPLTLARYLPDGRLDRSFGQDGRITLYLFDSPSSGEGPIALAIQPDGKAVVAAQSEVVRLNTNGALDPTFAQDGKLLIRGADGFAEDLVGVALTPAGKLLVAGSHSGDFGLVRLKPNGGFDRSFGTDGRVRTDFGTCDQLRDMATLRDGDIVLVGVGLNRRCIPGNRVKLKLARYGPNGVLDHMFGDAGIVTQSILDRGGSTRVAAARQGDVVVLLQGALRLYRPSGDRVRSFGTNGLAPIPDMSNPYELPIDLAVDADGRFIVVGSDIAGAPGRGGHFQIFRFLPSGRLDSSFGVMGQTLTTFGGDAVAWAVAIDDRNRIVAAGMTNWEEGDFGLARYVSA